MGSVTEQDYVFDAAWEDERHRLELLEMRLDPATLRRLERIGIAPGWRCLEVGAGQGSIARQLGRRVGPDGSVVAIDLETAFLQDGCGPNVEVRVADVHDVDLPLGSFDLIHARALLMHLPDRTRAIRRMVSWLAPGGWLLVEDMDWLGETTTDPAWTELVRAYAKATPTVDWACGRELLPELVDAGLQDIDAGAELDVIHGATALADWYRLCIRALRERLLAAGTASEGDIEVQLARLSDPAFRGLGVTWIGAWGRNR